MRILHVYEAYFLSQTANNFKDPRVGSIMSHPMFFQRYLCLLFVTGRLIIVAKIHINTLLVPISEIIIPFIDVL